MKKSSVLGTIAFFISFLLGVIGILMFFSIKTIEKSGLSAIVNTTTAHISITLILVAIFMQTFSIKATLDNHIKNSSK